jgi:hypothetical protein
MKQGTVVLAGRISVEHLRLDALIAEFGWSLINAGDLCRLAELNESKHIVAVLFSPKGLELPWDRALSSTMAAAPHALPILCHGFAEPVDWPVAAEAGAFHSLLLPFKLHEVRQSLGFAWSAMSRSTPTPIRQLQRLRSVLNEEALQSHAQAAGVAG